MGCCVARRTRSGHVRKFLGELVSLPSVFSEPFAEPSHEARTLQCGVAL